jgi:hypothetical protein
MFALPYFLYSCVGGTPTSPCRNYLFYYYFNVSVATLLISNFRQASPARALTIFE